MSAGTVYLVIFAIAVAPSARVQEHQRLGVTSDAQIFRLHPMSFFRYYAIVHGNAYIYFEIGMQFAGRTLPPLTDPVAARLAQVRNQACCVSESRLPYRDFDSVYPPLAALYFRALSTVAGTFDGFFALLRLLNLVAIVAMIWLGKRSVSMVTGGHSKGYWPMAILLAAAVGPRYLSYYDALPALCLTLALHEGVAKRWTMAGMAIAGGAWLKVFAIFLVPVFLIGAWRDRRWTGMMRFLAGAIGVSLITLLPWLLVGDTHFMEGIFQQSGRQYLEYGSVVGSTMIILRQLGLSQFEYGSELDSLAIVSPFSAMAVKAAPVMIGTGVIAVAAAVTRLESRNRLVWILACSAIVASVLMGAPVYSPQYNLTWFSVLVVSAFLAPRLWPLCLAYCLVTQIQHPIVEGLPDGPLQENARAVVFAIRNSLFVWLVWTLWQEMRRHRADH